MSDINIKEHAKQLHPTGFESADRRFSIECCDEGVLQLTTRALPMDNEYYMHPERDYVQKLDIDVSDIDRLIDILHKAKSIECRSWSTVKKELEDTKIKYF